MRDLIAPQFRIHQIKRFKVQNKFQRNDKSKVEFNSSIL